ncbi:ABC transporter permease [Microbacterium sp. SORGH_AS_0888]|uniref:ABC transporter permease n=1 Tax=Microbacterium sp. SORGH_AS_0888 TaxID=3041791 RepID=UPI0027807C81|nr:ABC transporter permease subunit [Microbacterium sp. SORGH_AS_0888]MDQ1129402.1 NitT/TauT family transport system permease protein [Microbacterium sp. SORGH_AS_0888]
MPVWLRALAPIVFGIAAIVVWEVLVIALGIKPFVLPAPSEIWSQFVARFPTIVQSAGITGLNALLGLVLGVVLAILAAVIAALLDAVDELTQPLVTALSVIPIAALAPVLYTMYGADQQTARVIIAALAVFVPVYVNTLRGLRQVQPVHRDLMRANAATGWQATRTVTLPGAVPYLFTGIRIASSLAVISALIAEYFGGPVNGLATAITSAISYSATSLAYAFVLGSVLLGLLFFVVALGLERLATRHGAPAS